MAALFSWISETIAVAICSLLIRGVWRLAFGPPERRAPNAERLNLEGAVDGDGAPRVGRTRDAEPAHHHAQLRHRQAPEHAGERGARGREPRRMRAVDARIQVTDLQTELHAGGRPCATANNGPGQDLVELAHGHRRGRRPAGRPRPP